VIPKQYIEELKKGCGCEYEEWSYDEDGIPVSSEDRDCSNFFGLCPTCKKRIKEANDILKMCNKSHDDFVKKLKKKFSWTNGEVVSSNWINKVVDKLSKELKKEMGK